MSEAVVERIRALPAGIDELVGESLAEELDFVARLRDDWLAGTNCFDQPGEAFFTARVGDALAGVCGLNRDPFAGDPRCGRLRRLYVRVALRRHGVGRALTCAALAAAEGCFSQVRLRTHDPDADGFYRALGFEPVEGDPDATHVWRL